MPVLFIALLALAAFGLIGALLAAAVILEAKRVNKEEPPSREADSPATPIHKHA